MSEHNGHHGESAVDEILSLPVPRGWVRTSVSAIGDVRLGRQRSPKNRSAAYPTKYLRAANITWAGLNLTDVLDMEFRPAELEAYRLQPGDLLLSEASGSPSEVGKPAMWNDEIVDCCFQNTVIRFRPKAVAPKFALLAFQHFARNAVVSRVARGVGIHHLSADRFASLPFLLPPEQEQQRIVERADELLSDLDAGVAALERAKANLKRYRASILKSAMDGSLTAEWREKHPQVEMASKLLERILTERRQKWEADQLVKFTAAGKEPPKNWRDKYSHPLAPDLTDLPSLPYGWCWSALEALADIVGGITKDQKKANGSGMRQVPYLRVANVQRGFLFLSEIKTIAASEQDITALRLKLGDVLFTEGGDRDKLGRGWVWSDELAECIHQNHIFRARPFLLEMQPRLISHYANSSGREWFARAGRQTTNLASINLGVLRRFPVPLPPVLEQAEIIAVLDEKLSQVGAAEQAIAHGLKRAARLRQSILKDAFEGRLVMQDVGDEPAAVLLIRLQQQSKIAVTGNGSTFHKPRNLPKEVFLRRASVVSYAVRRLASHRSFGRTQLEKTVHLAQCHLGVDLGFHFQRYAAGPFDKDIYKLESIAKKKDWFTAKQRPKFGVTYHPGTKIDDMCRFAIEHLGTKQAELDRLLGYIAEMNTDEAELLATAYAAWNDLLIEGRPADDDDAIIAEVHGWHPQKAKFTPQMIRSKLRWMRQHGYVPKGEGERTQEIAKETKLKSRRRRVGQ